MSAKRRLEERLAESCGVVEVAAKDLARALRAWDRERAMKAVAEEYVKSWRAVEALGTESNVAADILRAADQAMERRREALKRLDDGEPNLRRWSEVRAENLTPEQLAEVDRLVAEKVAEIRKQRADRESALDELAAFDEEFMQ